MNTKATEAWIARFYEEWIARLDDQAEAQRKTVRKEKGR
jgi:hypothetical protein